MEIYDDDFISNLREQLALDNFTIKEDEENSTDSFVIYSPAGDEYYLFCPYRKVYRLYGFNSDASRYQKACDKNLITTHIKHCESISIRKFNLQ